MGATRRNRKKELPWERRDRERREEARKLALGGFRFVKLGDIPPIKTDLTAGQWLHELQRAMADTMLKQHGQLIEPAKIDPFQAEPCAVAVLFAARDELDTVDRRLKDVEALAGKLDYLGESRRADERVVRETLKKLLEETLPELHGRIERLERENTELRELVALPVLESGADEGP
jgi:hypothetical protein